MENRCVNLRRKCGTIVSDVRYFVRGWVRDRIDDAVAWYLRWLEESPDRGY